MVAPVEELKVFGVQAGEHRGESWVASWGVLWPGAAMLPAFEVADLKDMKQKKERIEIHL